MAKNKKKEEEKISEADIERLELLQRANDKVGKQLSINTEKGNLEEIDELRDLIGKEFENPEEKYNIYYRGIRNLLMAPLRAASRLQRNIDQSRRLWSLASLQARVSRRATGHGSLETAKCRGWSLEAPPSVLRCPLPAARSLEANSFETVRIDKFSEGVRNLPAQLQPEKG